MMPGMFRNRYLEYAELMRQVREWAERQGWGGRAVSPETAAGILVGALGTLQAHFGLG